MGSKGQLGLYDPNYERSSCGVGFITRKDSKQTHHLITLGHEALCSVPHRGGMSSEGVGDGAGISIDLSQDFFESIVGKPLSKGLFGVGNFFMPTDRSEHKNAHELISSSLENHSLKVLLIRDVPVNNLALTPSAIGYQLPVVQWIFEMECESSEQSIEKCAYQALLDIEKIAYTEPRHAGLYPLSLSSRMQVLKGRLSSNELVPYFSDLNQPNHCINTLFFHTRFSTNTDPHPTMAQPFRMIAHNGELNTDKKNRLSENAIAKAKDNRIIRPNGQSDSCRLDQTFHSRIMEDDMDLVTAVVSMMPPAWENDNAIYKNVRDML
jgi:glutamate synthase (NADPH/NADH) large chain